PGLASCADLYPSTRSPCATELTTSQSQGELDSSASFLCSSVAARGILTGSCLQCAQKSSQSSRARSLRHRSNRSSAASRAVFRSAADTRGSAINTALSEPELACALLVSLCALGQEKSSDHAGADHCDGRVDLSRGIRTLFRDGLRVKPGDVHDGVHHVPLQRRVAVVGERDLLGLYLTAGQLTRQAEVVHLAPHVPRDRLRVLAARNGVNLELVGVTPRPLHLGEVLPFLDVGEEADNLVGLERLFNRCVDGVNVDGLALVLVVRNPVRFPDPQGEHVAVLDTTADKR